MATKINWNEVMTPVDVIDAQIKATTGISLREKIEKRKERNPMRNEQLFVATPFGQLPVRTFKRIH